MKITTQKKKGHNQSGKKGSSDKSSARKKASTSVYGVPPVTGARKKKKSDSAGSGRQKDSGRQKQQTSKSRPTVGPGRKKKASPPVTSIRVARTPYRKAEVEDLNAPGGSHTPFLVSQTSVDSGVYIYNHTARRATAPSSRAPDLEQDTHFHDREGQGQATGAAFHQEPDPYSIEELTGQLMNYFINSEGSSSRSDYSPGAKGNPSGAAHLPVDILDTEIRDRLSDLVMVLLQEEKSEQLYSLLVEYKEFIRDIMNMLE